MIKFTFKLVGNSKKNDIVNTCIKHHIQFDSVQQRRNKYDIIIHGISKEDFKKLDWGQMPLQFTKRNLKTRKANALVEKAERNSIKTDVKVNQDLTIDVTVYMDENLFRGLKWIYSQ